MELECLVSRQPIFDANKNVFAYQLLFRSDMKETICSYSSDTQSASLMTESFFSSNIDLIVNKKPVMIKFTPSLLMNRFYEFVPSSRLIIEIDENTPRDQETLDILSDVKKTGYKILFCSGDALDSTDPLVRFIDIIKIDFAYTSRKLQYDKAAYFLTTGIEMLAGNIETDEIFKTADILGYNYFQGSFFCNPNKLRKGRIHESKLSKLNLLKIVNAQEIDFKEVSALIRNDLDLSFKLLKYINSAYFGFKRKISDIQQAAVHLGAKGLKKWVSLMVISCLNDEKPSELLATSIIRARICEQLAVYFDLNSRSDELFIMGMFSTLEAMLGVPINDILHEIPLAEDIKEALNGDDGTLNRILQFVMGYEKGQWSLMECMSNHFSKIEKELPVIYADAIHLSEQVLNFS